MNLAKENLELSGKGVVLTTETVHENIKLMTDTTEFHELLTTENDQPRRVGWIIPNSLQILADFTTHTKSGMRGKSTEDVVERALLIDDQQIFEQLASAPLMDVDTTTSQEILDGMFDKNVGKHVNLEGEDETDGMIILSPASDFLFVQTERSSIRVHGEDGIYVLNRNTEEGDKLVIIDQKDGVNISGNKDIRIGPDGIFFDGEPFDIGTIVGTAMQSVATSMHSLASLGGTIGKSFGKSFSKSFGKKFKGDFDIDLDFDDTFDVDDEY